MVTLQTDVEDLVKLFSFESIVLKHAEDYCTWSIQMFFAAQKQLPTWWINVVVSLHICGKHLLPMWLTVVVVGYES